MKYFILMTTLIATSTCSTIAMDDTIYTDMLGRINNAAIGNPSITLINNSKISVCMEIGDLKKDEIRSRMYLHPHATLTFSPYAHPFFLNKEYSKRGALIDLYTTRPEEKNSQHKQLLIGGISEIRFGDTAYINYDDNILNITHHNTEQLKRSSKTLKIARRNTLK